MKSRVEQAVDLFQTGGLNCSLCSNLDRFINAGLGI